MSVLPIYPERVWHTDLEDGRLWWPGGHIELAPHEAAIWGMLDKAYPHKARMQRLIMACYPEHLPDCDLPDDARAAVSALASRLRHKLEQAKAPFTIHRGDLWGLWIEVRA